MTTQQLQAIRGRANLASETCEDFFHLLGYVAELEAKQDKIKSIFQRLHSAWSERFEHEEAEAIHELSELLK